MHQDAFTLEIHIAQLMHYAGKLSDWAMAKALALKPGKNKASILNDKQVDCGEYVTSLGPDMT
jgi:hypothetical protein